MAHLRNLNHKVMRSGTAPSERTDDRIIDQTKYDMLQTFKVKRSKSKSQSHVTANITAMKDFLTRTSEVQSTRTFLAHSSTETLLETAVTALVAFVLVDGAVALKSTRVDVVLAHRTTEESFAAVTRRSAVVFTSGAVETDGAVRSHACCSSKRRIIDTANATTRRYYRSVHYRHTTELTADR